jgi:hypothetical protein
MRWVFMYIFFATSIARRICMARPKKTFKLRESIIEIIEARETMTRTDLARALFYRGGGQWTVDKYGPALARLVNDGILAMTTTGGAGSRKRGRARTEYSMA